MQQPTPTNKEIFCNHKSMITEIDIQGRIIYADHAFLEMSGYDLHELIGIPHHIIRHPDMPKAVVSEMWSTLKQGNSWYGYIKNLTKEGSFCWFHLNITPRIDEHGKIIGYVAARKAPNPKNLDQIKKEYAALLELESNNRAEPLQTTG